eukprot:3364738-Prymnesium_polylepis.1
MPRAVVRVLDRVGFHLEPDDARARVQLRLVVLDDEAQVVVDVRLAGLRPRDVLRAEEAEPETAVVPATTGGADIPRTPRS